ncbi:M48 family metallopeptidase [Candidatus Micrarchaeota archaeon]|nr:M48 family metallopeptidase [Candidatus Micrarchaeota archaeon]
MEEIIIDGKKYLVHTYFSNNRSARITLREGNVLNVSLPTRWPKTEQIRISQNLISRAIKSISAGKWCVPLSKNTLLTSGSSFSFFGYGRLRVFFVLASSDEVLSNSDSLTVHSSCSDPSQFTQHCNSLLKLKLLDLALPKIRDRIEYFNSSFFKTKISKISIRDNSGIWGSCSAKSKISLNYKLLFLPSEIVDYVIVHELAHTQFSSHGPRFWSLVKSVMPDYENRKRWLKLHGSNEIALLRSC